MNFNSDAMGYSKSKGVLGIISEVSFSKSTITLESENGDFTVVDMDDVKLLEIVGIVGEEVVYDGDVLMASDGLLYEVELQEDKVHVKLHLLNEGFERIEVGEKFVARNIALLSKGVEVLGSIYELLTVEEEEVPKLKVDFNIRVVREFENGNTTYFYACNNAEKEEVDLIKVIYMGHHILEEEQYERRTIAHEVYLDSIEAGTLKEVNPQELLNYVTGATYNKTSDKSEPVLDDVDMDDEEEDDDEDECNCEECRYNRGETPDNDCQDCGKGEDDCKCEW